MARGELIGRVCVGAPVPAAVVAIGFHALSRLPSEPDGTGSLLSAWTGPWMVWTTVGAWSVGLLALVWAGIAARRTEGASVAPVLVALMVLFMAALAALFATVAA